jgi:type VI secretion system secreted protein VgrG
MSTLTQEHRYVRIDTPLGTDKLVLKSFTAHEELGRLFRFDVELLSEDHDIKFEDIIGENVTINLVSLDHGTRYWNGLVSQFTQVAPLHRFARYQAVVVPWLWFLTRSADCRIFQNKTVPDIIEDVFKKLSFDAFESRLTGSYPTWEYCVQYRESAFNFVSRLMEQEGIYYYFKHEDGKHTLILADAGSAHEPFAGYEEIIWRPPDVSAKSGESIRDWVVTKEALTGRYAHTDFNFETPKTSLEARSENVHEHAKADFEVFDYPGEYEQHGDGDHYAQLRIEEIHAQYETVRGSGDSRGLCAGYRFKLKEQPRQDQNRDYLVCSTDYTVDSDVFVSRGGGDAGRAVACSFAAIEASAPFRSARTTPKPSIQGPQTAIVVGPAGEEIYPDKYGRVKVQFHWDRYGKKNENSSCWIRVSQPWAGKNWGTIALPRIGQEVVVDFLEGDPDQPLITGRVYNADQMPPYSLPADMTQSGMKSRSTKGGGPANFNEIRFEDKKGSEQLYVHAEKNQDIEVESDETHWVGGDREKTIDGDETTLVKGTRRETVKKDEEITIEGSRAEEVKQDESIIVAGKRSRSVGKDEMVEVQGKRTKTVGKDEEIAIGGKRSTTVAKDETLTIDGQMTVTVDKSLSMKVTKSIAIEAGSDVLIRCGSAKVLLKKDGKVQVEGSQLNFKASGNVKVKGSSVAIN